MASGKTKRKKTSTKITVIKVIVASVLILSILGYFVHMTGVLPRNMSAITITETNAAGVTSKVGEVSVNEANFHFQEIYNMYRYMNGMDTSMLDTVVDTTNNKTFREIMMEQVGDDMIKTLILVRAAKADGYDQSTSGAKRYAEMDVDSIRESIKSYNYPSADYYLQNAYGTGMTVRSYKEYMERDCLFQEYQQYIYQFKFSVTEDQIDALYNENPTDYQKLNMNYYFFKATFDDNGKATDLDAVKAKAQEVVNKATDSQSFRDAVESVLTKDNNEEALKTFADGANPTEHNNYDPANLSNKSEDIQKFFTDAKDGDKTVVMTDEGAYAIFLTSKTLDETPTVTYRTLTLSNDVFNKEGATLEEIAAGAASLKTEAEAMVNGVTTAQDFAALVKKNTDNANEIVSGGLQSTATADAFDKEKDSTVTDLQAELGQWLFASERTTGNTLVQVASDNSTVTIYFFQENLPAWKADAKTEVNDKLAADYVNQLMGDKTEYKIHYKTIKYLSY